ncbi:MAG: hypothetical protein HRT90_06525 [Candidatus Margulisbacteria bacterium]|nr:hypothetical protein [Candidatus Margulisiibacteriota bacterium]
MLEIMESIITFIKLITRIFKSIKESIYFRITNKIPKKTIIVAPNPNPHDTWWHMGSQGINEPTMQISGSYQVTNITEDNINLSAVEMKKPNVMGNIIVKDSKSHYYGSYPIPSKYLTDISFDFLIKPPFKKTGESFKADVAIIDQFGNEHWIKGIVFVYP